MSPIDPSHRLDRQVRIGHVHLKVADLERAIDFYCGVLGFEITQRYGTQAAFVSAGGYHHHIGLKPGRAWEAPLPPPGRRVCFTPRSSIRLDGRWPTACDACWRRGLSWMEPAITA